MLKYIARIGYVVVALLALVGLLSVLTRFAFTMQYLADGSRVSIDTGNDFAEQFEGRYYAHPYLTLVHVVTGFLFMTIGPIQFWPAVRNRWIALHRTCGWIWMFAALINAVSALLFVGRLPVFGHLSASAGVVVGGSTFLVCLAQGFRSIRRRDITRHREWMIRAFAIGLGISTFRVLIPLLIMPPINATFDEAWDTVAWLGFVINLGVAEVWINVTRRQPQSRPVRSALPRSQTASEPVI